MKSVVIYYSYTGNTKKVAEILFDNLKSISEVEMLELKAKDESGNFFGQASRAFCRKRAEIAPINFDLSKYDLVCLGTPVWAFGPAPAMNTYLDNCVGLKDKNIILFTTYGSGAGNQGCLDFMQGVLAKKGAKRFKNFSLQQGKVKSQDFVSSMVKQVIPDI